MKNRQFLCAALLTITGLLMSLRLSHATAQEATVVIAGNHPSVALAGWSHAAGNLELHMVAVLALRNRRELNELKAQLQQPGSPNYHRWLSTAEFMRRFGPTQRQMNEVMSWLRNNHFTIVNANLVTRTVRFSGTVTQAERAFSTEIVSNSGGYANVSDPRVPTRLAGTIAAIFGLSGEPAAGRHMSLAGLGKRRRTVRYERRASYPDCTVFAGYQVGPGYDLGTGLGSADIDKLVGAFPPSAPTASVTASDTRSSGSAGQTVGGGVMTLTNTGSLPETVSTVTLNVSNPALFSFLSLSASVDVGKAYDELNTQAARIRGPGQAAVSGPLSSIVTFTFAPPLAVPVGGKAALTLRAGMTGASQVARRFGSPGSTTSGGGRGAGQLAAVLGMIGFGLVFASSGNRRRMRLFSAMFLMIAATQVGCGSDNRVAVVGTSVQSVPPCGIGASSPSVGSATGAVGVTGLPATLGQIRLVK